MPWFIQVYIDPLSTHKNQQFTTVTPFYVRFSFFLHHYSYLEGLGLGRCLMHLCVQGACFSTPILWKSSYILLCLFAYIYLNHVKSCQIMFPRKTQIFGYIWMSQELVPSGNNVK